MKQTLLSLPCGPGEQIPKQVQQSLIKGSWHEKKLDLKLTGLCFLQSDGQQYWCRLGVFTQCMRQKVAPRIP